MILTLVRLDGCAGTRLHEIEGGVWTVPVDRVKGLEGKVEEFHFPLSQAAEALVIDHSAYFDDVLFLGVRGGPISSRALEVCLDALREPRHPHRFRASFRIWVQDTDACALGGLRDDPGA